MMQREIYILGTSHEYQRNDETCAPGSIDEFRHYLKSVCDKYRIIAIGEELSRTALEDFNLIESIPEQFARIQGLRHKHCDPNRDEQKSLGIKESGTYTQTKKLPEIFQPEDIRNLTQEEAEDLEWNEDLKREPYWLCKILELN